jgi:hypothetical protein
MSTIVIVILLYHRHKPVDLKDEGAINGGQNVCMMQLDRSLDT